MELNFNPTPEKRALRAKGYLGEGDVVTEKVKILEDNDPLDPFYHKSLEIEAKQFKMFCVQMNQYFPIVGPSGRYVRSRSLKLIADRLRAFMGIYPYDLNTIREATENYTERCKRDNNKYILHIAKFILHGYDESTLALECELVEHHRKLEGFGYNI